MTGQITDSLRWTVGRHSFKFGGEYRHTNVYSISLGSSSRGTFTFDGTAGPWSATSSLGAVTATLARHQTPGISTVQCNGVAQTHCYCKLLRWQASSSGVCNTNILSVADFFFGQTSVTSANLAKARVGNGTRTYLLNQEDFWASDSYQATRDLSLNTACATVCRGTSTMQQTIFMGHRLRRGSQIYSHVQFPILDGGFAPRVGFAYNVFGGGKTVLRGAWGMIYDVPAMQSMAAGASSNPAGPNPSYVASTPSFNFKYNVNPFATAAIPPQFSAAGIQTNYRIAYQFNFSLGIEQQLSRNTLFSIGYIGSEGRRLPVTYDLNQGTSYTASTNVIHRPYDLPVSGGPAVLQFANQTVASNQNFTSLTQLVSGGTSNYSSLSVSLRQTSWKGLTANLNYIWAHSLDDGSSPINNRQHQVRLWQRRQRHPSYLRLGFVTYALPNFTRTCGIDRA